MGPVTKDFGCHNGVIYHVKEFGPCCLEMRMQSFEVGLCHD